MLIYWSDSIKKMMMTKREVVLKINMLKRLLAFRDEIMLKHKIKNVRASILKKKNLREMRCNLKKAWGS